MRAPCPSPPFVLCLVLVGVACASRPPSRATIATPPPSTFVSDAQVVSAPSEPVLASESAPLAPEPAAAPQPVVAAATPRRRVCNPSELNALLRTLPVDLENPVPQHAKLSELPDAEPPSTAADDDGFGFFGTRDLDANGKLDRVVLYTSVDYWLWLLFIDKPSCEKFIGAIPGYSVSVQNTMHQGHRDLVALSYPVQGQNESFWFDGKQYVKH